MESGQFSWAGLTVRPPEMTPNAPSILSDSSIDCSAYCLDFLWFQIPCAFCSSKLCRARRRQRRLFVNLEPASWDFSHERRRFREWGGTLHFTSNLRVFVCEKTSNSALLPLTQLGVIFSRMRTDIWFSVEKLDWGRLAKSRMESTLSNQTIIFIIPCPI